MVGSGSRSVLSEDNAKPRSADHGGSETRDHRPELLNEFIEYNNNVSTSLPNARTAIHGHHNCTALGYYKSVTMSNFSKKTLDDHPTLFFITNYQRFSLQHMHNRHKSLINVCSKWYLQTFLILF